MNACLGATLVAVLLMAAPAANAQLFGRLFTDPERRADLDVVRDEHEYGKPPKAPEPVEMRKDSKAHPPALPQMTINGVVLRSSGNDTSWVNGARILSGQATPEGIRVEPRRSTSPAVRLVLPSGVDTTPIKPGQRIDVVSGTIVETYREPAREASPTRKNRLFDDTPGSGASVSGETGTPLEDPLDREKGS